MIKCEACKMEYLAIPVIPICRECGGWIKIDAAEIDKLNDGIIDDKEV
ncbi:MAG: hypothetical protein ABIA77_01975 [Candidatus Omnitrophota bacterium]